MDAPIVTTDWLAAHLDDPGVRIVEISSKPERDIYREGHIPGAVWFYWKDICWHDTDREFVSPEKLAARLGAAGIGPDHTLVLYSDVVQYGTYAYWAFTMAGRRNLRVLDGSRTKWTREVRPLTKDVPRYASVPYAPQPGDASMRIGRDAVRAGLGQPGRLLLDVRSPEEYAGERVMELGKFDHGAERAGRIPGAVHLYFRNLLNDDDSFKSPEALRRIFERVGVSQGEPGEVIVYCRLSHRATLTWVALTKLLGVENVRIYDGSWTEWGSIVGFPVER
ncbi:MAG: sulfurtransferase [Burkholderiales bacterium]|nr:sulfurtransferase [Burkholderiales bacterium]